MTPSSSAGQRDGVDGRRHRNSVAFPGPPLKHGDLIGAQVAAQVDELGGVACDAFDLLSGCGWFGRRVDADHPPRPPLAGETGDHAGMGRAGDTTYDDGVEEDAEFFFLLLHFVGPVRETQSAEPVIRGSGRDGVRCSAGTFDILDGVVPAVFELDAEARRVEPDIGAHDP